MFLNGILDVRLNNMEEMIIAFISLGFSGIFTMLLVQEVKEGKIVGAIFSGAIVVFTLIVMIASTAIRIIGIEVNKCYITNPSENPFEETKLKINKVLDKKNRYILYIDDKGIKASVKEDLAKEMWVETKCSEGG